MTVTLSRAPAVSLSVNTRTIWEFWKHCGSKKLGQWHS